MARRTIAQILERDGLNPAPERNRKTTSSDGWQSVQVQADPVFGPYTGLTLKAHPAGVFCRIRG